VYPPPPRSKENGGNVELREAVGETIHFRDLRGRGGRTSQLQRKNLPQKTLKFFLGSHRSPRYATHRSEQVQNFSPLLDLRWHRAPISLDFYARIASLAAHIDLSQKTRLLKCSSRLAHSSPTPIPLKTFFSPRISIPTKRFLRTPIPLEFSFSARFARLAHRYLSKFSSRLASFASHIDTSQNFLLCSLRSHRTSISLKTFFSARFARLAHRYLSNFSSLPRTAISLKNFFSHTDSSLALRTCLRFAASHIDTSQNFVFFSARFARLAHRYLSNFLLGSLRSPPHRYLSKFSHFGSFWEGFGFGTKLRTLF